MSCSLWCLSFQSGSYQSSIFIAPRFPTHPWAQSIREKQCEAHVFSTACCVSPCFSVANVLQGETLELGGFDEWKTSCRVWNSENAADAADVCQHVDHPCRLASPCVALNVSLAAWCGRLRYAAKYWDYMEKFLDRCRKYLTIVNGMYRMSTYRNGDQRKHQY